MKDREYTQLWQERIRPALKELSPGRKKERMRYLCIFFGGAGIVVAMMAWEYDFPWWVALTGIAVTVVAFLLHGRTENNFRKHFKHQIFAVLNDIAGLEWSILTDLADYTGADLLEESQLYHGYDNVTGDDKLRTSFRSATIDVCELTAHLELRDEPVRTIFQGFLSKVSIDKPFSGETYVQTEGDGRIIDSGAGGLFDGSKDISETELEWGEFERFLVVKSSDPTEARQIFTPDFMAVLYDWWRTHDEPLRLSFRGSAMYVGFPTDVNLEPALLGSLDNERVVVREILEFMLMLEELAKLLVEEQHRRYE